VEVWVELSAYIIYCCCGYITLSFLLFCALVECMAQPDPRFMSREVADVVSRERSLPPIDFNLEIITLDEDIIGAIKTGYPQFSDFIPVISRLNSLSFIEDTAKKEWWENEVELLIEERLIYVDETDVAAWNFINGLRWRLLFMVADAYKGHKSRVIRERRTVVGYEPPEREEKRGWWGRR